MRPGGCPDRNVLEDYALGRLPNETIESLGQHIESCPHCQANVAAFDEVAEELADQLIGGVSGSPFAGEVDRERALALAISVMDDAPSPDASPDASRDHRQGTASRLGEYELLEPIGQGGMGTVYRAFHTQMNRTVAIKVLPRWYHADERAIERFQREIDVVARLDHPNIVRAYDARETDGERFLVTEFVSGLDLSELVRRCGPLPLADACELIRQAAVALQYVHEHALIHRDVKPSNLMLDDTGHVKLLDLGLAFVPGHGDELTDPGQMMGTLDYMAPEQASDSHDVDIRADVYGLGATLYKLLCGESPLASSQYDTPVKKLQALTRGQMLPVRSRRPDVPGSLAAAIDRALSKQAEDRFGTPAELGRALEPFCADCDLRALIERAGRQASCPRPPDQSLVSTSRMASCASERTTPGTSAGSQPNVLPTRRRVRRIAAVCAGIAGILILAGVIIVIRRNGQETVIHVPDKSKVQIDVRPDGDVRVDVERRDGVVGSVPPAAGAAPIGWCRQRCDLGGTSFYPVPTRTPTGHQLALARWNPDGWRGHVRSVVTGDLTGDGYLEVVLRDADTVVAFDRWAKELWRRDPVIDSGVPVPEGRVGVASRLELADLDNDGAVEVVVVAGSEAPGGWSLKAPQCAVIYDGDGSVLRAFSIIEGAGSVPRGCVDFNGDSYRDMILVVAAYRHPHAICIYDSVSGQLLFRADFSDAPEVAGVADMDNDGQIDLYLLQSYTCHVDPPVDDYDSDYCYATRYDPQGTRLWKQQLDADAADGGLVDVDGDGVLDLILITDVESGGELHLLDSKTGNSKRSFAEFAGPWCRFFSIADVSGDGAKEIVIGDGEELRVLDARAQVVSPCPAPDTYVLATNDLDGDGRTEIVARRDRDLIVFSGELEELDRYTAPMPIVEAIIGDIGGDGVNEVIVLGREDQQTSLTAIHFGPRAPDDPENHSSQPWQAVRSFLAALQSAGVDRALDHVLANRRESLREQMKNISLESIPAEFEYQQAVHVDDASVTIPGDPVSRFTLRYANDTWWIIGVTTGE